MVQLVPRALMPLHGSACALLSRQHQPTYESLANTARRLCSEYVDPSGIPTLVACRLIAIDKCPGVRPIGVVETVRRVIGKAIATAISNDIQEAAGPLQVCAGHLSGCEVAVHAMHQVYQSSSTEAVILVDACNAFNSLNRETALRNILYLCPPLAKILVNTYRDDVQLFIDGHLLSQEGTTQGENIEMAKKVFQGTGISVTEEGKIHLGAAIGTQAFVESYIERKVSEWVNAVERLSSIAHTQPHAAYAAFTHG